MNEEEIVVLSPMEKKEIISRVKAMKDVELELALKAFPTIMLESELQRRYESAVNKVDTLILLCNNSIKDNMTIDEMSDFLNNVKSIMSNNSH